MKSVTLALLAALTAVSFAADTPADIAADYREKAAAALAKVNETLEKATVPLVAALVKSGDTAGADLLNEQLKAKIAGEPVPAPQGSATALFKSFDAARAKALEPAQKAAVKCIDAVLASSEGKKLDVVSELGKVRAEVESAKVVAQFHIIEIEANSEGYQLGKLNKGQIIKLQYIEGEWSAYVGWPPESPDQATMLQHRLCIVDVANPSKQHEVPSGTKKKAFSFKVPNDAQYTVRITDPQLQSNTGKVSYAIGIIP